MSSNKKKFSNFWVLESFSSYRPFTRFWWFLWMIAHKPSPVYCWVDLLIRPVPWQTRRKIFQFLTKLFCTKKIENELVREDDENLTEKSKFDLLDRIKDEKWIWENFIFLERNIIFSTKTPKPHRYETFEASNLHTIIFRNIIIHL